MTGIARSVITVSDKGSRGEREDLSGPEIARLLARIGPRSSIRPSFPMSRTRSRPP